MGIATDRWKAAVQRAALAASVAAVWGAVLAQPSPQTVQDEYAEYELLAPETSSFKTVYDVSVTSAGATTFFDRIGRGLSFVAGAGDGAIDLMTGAPLRFEQEADGLRIHLARPVGSLGRPRNSVVLPGGI